MGYYHGCSGKLDYMSRAVLFVIFQLLVGKLFGSNIDSLRALYLQSFGEEKLILVNKLSEVYTYIDLDSAWYYNSAAEQLWKNLKPNQKNKYEHLILWRKAMLNHGYGKFDSSSFYYTLAEVKSKEKYFEDYLEIRMNHLALLTQNKSSKIKNEFEKYINQLDTSIEKHQELYYWAKYQYSKVCEAEANYKEAANSLIPLLNFPSTHLKIKFLSAIKYSIGIQNFKLNNFRIAKSYFKEALINEIDRSDSLNILINLAETHFKLNEVDSAILILKALPYEKLLKQDQFEYWKIWYDISCNTQTDFSMTKCISEMTNLSNQIDRIGVKFNLLFRIIKDNLRNNKFKSAEKNLEELNKLFAKDGIHIETYDRVNFQMLKVQQMIGSNNNPSLLEEFLKYNEFRNQLEIQIAQSAVNEQMTIYQTELKERENLFLKSEKKFQGNVIKNQRVGLFVGSVAFALISILSFFLYRQKEKQRQLNHKVTLQKDQIQTLNSELNHRVKNNLAFMTSLLEMQGRRTESQETKLALKESESRLKALALVHTQLFKNEQNTEINLKHYLSEIIANLQGIFEISDKTLNFKTELIDYSINAEDAMRMGLIVNELVTNSVKHAFHEVANPEIQIATRWNESGKLVLQYKDNGPGISKVMGQDINANSMGSKLIELLRKTTWV